MLAPPSTQHAQQETRYAALAIMIVDLAIMAVFPVIPLMLPHPLFGYPLPK